MKQGTFIGVDPDTNKSGIAVIQNGDIALLDTLSFADVCDLFLYYRNQDWDNTTAVIESSWNTAHNWHGKATDNRRLSAKKGYDVGRCHQVGISLCEMSKYFGLNTIQHQPLKKCWKGSNGKITHHELQQLFPQLQQRTNQEERDALLLVAHYVGLPCSMQFDTILHANNDVLKRLKSK